MIKLVACDLDGTLLNSKMLVSPENVAAIRSAQENGIEFLVATGRAPAESKSFLKDVKIKTGFINLNGALIFDNTGKLIIKHELPKTKVIQLINLLEANNFYFEIVSQKKVYTENLNTRITNIAHLIVDANPAISFKEAVAISAGNKSILKIKQVDDFKQLLQDKKVKIMKIIAFDHRGHEAFSQIIPKIKKIGNLIVTSSSSSNIEINAFAAQKGLALLAYAKKKGIKVEETAAIGDNLNDQSMIENAGVGVAMGNALPVIKDLAQVVTKTNNDNGVAFILKKFIESNKLKLR